MFKKFFFMIFLCFLNTSFAKNISVAVSANRADVSTELNEDQVLLLNGMRLAVTSELEELKYDSHLYWQKLEQKKMSAIEESIYLKAFFSSEAIARSTGPVIETGSEKPIAKPMGGSKVNVPLILSGTFTATLDSSKLKSNFEDVISGNEEAKLKTFYFLSSIEIDKGMTWEDTGVSKSLNFTEAIMDSWKKLAEKNFGGFEKTVILERDFSKRPESMNSKSVILKWKSILKKVSENRDTQSAQYQLSAQYLLQNAKSGNHLMAFDFPEIKRTFETNNKSGLSSNLASLIYNLLLSQSAKIQSVLAGEAKMADFCEVELTVFKSSGLSEVYQINSFLQEKFQSLKLTSKMKSFENNRAALLVRAEGSEEKMLDALNAGGGRWPLNEQKVLQFNRVDKTFAILPKESNN
jgi:hypothetical protein